ncbi:hypothetical protein D0866_05938 [Hortaea werneckii]|uniref:Uncharacterized protein n=1 Tax=Hortaea werneckii TaxID=91943 RepID=A0A3M7B0U8_HORWE|nr:hypothetical protein D0866_05938 [Hortaea werneckii]
MAFQAIVDSFPMNGSRSVTQAQPAKVFRFQDLPPEMRNQICKYALVPDNNNRLRFMPGKSGGGANRFHVITHGLAYEAQWTHWELQFSDLYTALPLTQAMCTKNLEEVRLEGDADRLAAYFAENMRSDDRVPKIFNSGRRVRWRNGVAVTAPGTWRTKRQRAHASKDGDLHA